MAQSQVAHLVGVGRNEPLFARIRAEADEAAKHEPELAAFLLTTILNHDTLESARGSPRRRAARSRRRAERLT